MGGRVPTALASSRLAVERAAFGCVLRLQHRVRRVFPSQATASPPPQNRLLVDTVGGELTLPLDEMEYTTMPAVTEKFAERWQATSDEVPELVG